MSLLKTCERALKFALGAIARVFLRPARPATTPIPRERARRILLLRPTNIGDAVIALPTIDALRNIFPESAIDLLAGVKNQIVFVHERRLSRLFVFEKSVFKALALARKIRARRYDVVIDLTFGDSVTTLFMATCAGKTALRVGLNKRRHASFFEYAIVFPEESATHRMLSTVRALEAFGRAPLAGALRPLPIALGDPDRHSAEAVLGAEQGAEWWGLNISAGQPNRRWPQEKHAELLRSIVTERPNLRALVIATPEDRQLALVIAKESGVTCAVVPANLTLLEVSAIVARLRFLVTPDTALTHIARGFNVPVVSMHVGSLSEFARWRPYGQTGGWVQSSEENAIQTISVDQVVQAAREVWPPLEVSYG